MNKSFTLLLLFVACTTNLIQAQKAKTPIESGNSNTQSTQIQFYQNAYFNSLADGNAGSAITFLYGRIALEKENLKLKDTLCLLYFESNQPFQVITVGESILKNNPENQIIARVVTLAYQRTQQLTKALTGYEKLYTSLKKIDDLYQIATIQFDLKRYGEAEATLNAIIRDPNSKSAKTALMIGENQKQEVNFLAASINMLGVIYLELNKIQEGKLLFEKSLEAQNDFILPKQSLELISKYLKQLENPEKKDINSKTAPK